MRFVIQKHDASRLHYDFRLETKDGVLKSWAVPKGLSLDPSVKRLAVMTEDHPGDYIHFEGEIPEGNYGAGSVIVWDTGNYESDGDVNQQVKAGKIVFTLFGEKVKGSFHLVRTKQKNEKQWLLIKSRDQHSSTEDLGETMPYSVLSGRRIKPKSPESRYLMSVDIKGTPAVFPTSIKPMLALPVDKPFDKNDWVFEVKWDGVRAILFLERSKNILTLRSRRGADITTRYPEIISSVLSTLKCNNSLVLDGEVVVLDKNGIPDFQRHQKRMNVDGSREVAFLSKQSPATYFVFDVLYLDGLSLEGLDFVTRREILSKIVDKVTQTIRISDYIEEEGKAMFRSASSMKLEGIVAKYKFSKYMQGSRSSAWLKIKSVLTQDCVVVGYTKGEGNRKGLFGSLILAAYRGGRLRFVGHGGSGFGFEQLEMTLDMMQQLITDRRPIEHIPYVNRDPVWLRPELVAEVKFQSWTQDGIMRAPIFLRFREDKRPEECIIETPRDSEVVVDSVDPNPKNKETGSTVSTSRQSLTNLDKMFWNATSDRKALTKRHLVEYYDSISSFLLPHLRDRPLSLNRYPDGILGKSFFHKNWHQTQPEFAQSIQVFSESSQRVINHLVCNNKETLVWLANLGCIEMHPWYSHVHDFGACKTISRKTSVEDSQLSLDESKCGLERPDFIVFDLDPYIYSGKERGQEPEYNIRGFKATVRVALDLKDLLDSLKIQSFVKTSGKTGLHVFVPLAPFYTFEQTRMFAELIGRILLERNATKDRITMEWNTTKRKGKVFFDYNQNAKGKTVASVFSVRPTRSATVSMPVEWKDLEGIMPTDFTLLNVPGILKKAGDPWRHIMDSTQDLHSVLEHVSKVHF